ncbi:hypothetical protein [Paenibacillus sp. UNC451MF]|uniref:hypothetical protein n=1 Tax=Paenibacillus sp. UNC451MF TaxID=1449063 RepID=UPI001E3F2013|nr:hypothetical protein [Paenibacillus sp. UNC451MF]
MLLLPKQSTHCFGSADVDLGNQAVTHCHTVAVCQYIFLLKETTIVPTVAIHEILYTTTN